MNWQHQLFNIFILLHFLDTMTYSEMMTCLIYKSSSNSGNKLSPLNSKGHPLVLGNYSLRGFPVALVVKNLPASAGNIRDMGLIPGLRRSPGGGHGNPLQCSYLENPMDRGAWRATVL